ncbi:Gfo/Idh/MocA family oxidoreductase [Paenibacillus melissococcoides]|uniref:Gfo/Idh/MocA family oxidoreductase n=1 Tax=Paenibacillus melissococcoides TaxID=2912268 RepID=A0ABN8U7Y7_9BACL|nr:MULTISPECIES: Gfo/Idh/MocA family oxidoreductase [Paenibacillus]MEB9894450.1 Gfo/Idh/MocA family oxidoreductase [Bacillus cereus]CAH8246513.1 Gfo/Idh/MocA family oxidoreductase [Paenibacillus melissococcoides]CAH8714971.1 Gfo/Idh/MocA family oxidoreductase [Paenibacillus melissococcoides]CAH8715925.1 Gfo/Idh/MocA family oxidoreductase [Paenibacillus melissococcoides]GIO79147.1 myo-inositol 2-dehydrogenase [Paenibacillus dendritiformis]
MNSKKIRMAVIGLGHMGQYMLRLAAQPEFAQAVEIAAICEANEQAREQFRHTYRDSLPHAVWSSDYAALLEETDADLACISVPPAFHNHIVMEALRRKIHVFCEKPLANSVEEARELLQQAREAEVVHAIHFSMPHEPAVERVRHMLAEKAIGEIRKLDLILQFPQWPRAWQHNSWIGTRQQGGFVLEVGVHWIHVIQKLLGRITNVQSELELPAESGRCEKGIRAALRLDSGIPVHVSGMSGFSGEERVSLILYGTEGTIALENWDHLYTGAVGQPLEPVQVEDSADTLPVVRQVIRAIQGKPARYFTFQDGYDAQVVLEALRHPASSGWEDIWPQYS